MGRRPRDVTADTRELEETFWQWRRLGRFVEGEREREPLPDDAADEA